MIYYSLKCQTFTGHSLNLLRTLPRQEGATVNWLKILLGVCSSKDFL